MSSAPSEEPEQSATAATGNSRRSVGRRIAFCVAGAAIVGSSIAAGWFLQAALHSTAPAVTTTEEPAETVHSPDSHAAEHEAEHVEAKTTHAEHAAHGEELSHPPDAASNGRHPAAKMSSDHVAAEGTSASHADDHESEQSAEASGESAEAASPVGSPTAEVPPSAEELARADAYGEQKFLEGDAVAALREFDWLAQHQDRSLDDRFHYRCAVCAEAQGEFDRALSEYGTALSSAPDETIRVLSRVGQARIWRSLGQTDMAIQVLASAFLTNGNERRSAVVRPFVAYLLADALASEVVAANSTPLTEDKGVVFPAWKFDLFERSLLASIRVEETDGVPIAAGVRVLSEEADPVLQANLTRLGVRNIVDAVSRAAGRHTTWTDAAGDAVTGRSAEICLSHGSLALCLDGLTAPLGVVWTEQGDEIRLATIDEVKPEVVSQQRRAAAYRALVHAVKLYPDFRLAPHAQITLGNLALQDGRFEDAQAHYNTVFETAPRAVVRSDAWFNLAKLQFCCGQGGSALDSFWHVIDSGAAPEPAAVASLYIGRLLLDAEQPRRAILPLTRATQWTQESPVRAKAVLCLAAAHLLYGNPKTANDVLMDFRSDVETQSKEAALLSALARYRVAEHPTRKLVEGESLLTAAHPVRPADFFGRYGWYLCGQVYEDMMLPEMAAEVYRSALAEGEGLPYRNAIVFGLASSLADSGDSAASEPHFEELLQHAQPEWQRRAGFRLCQVQLDMRQTQEASRTARKLLEICEDKKDKSRALQLLGEAYQRLGNHAAAALCFAGSTPGEPPATDAGEQ
jgi:tetratricopeptide (TPR) repeat protein